MKNILLISEAHSEVADWVQDTLRAQGIYLVARMTPAALRTSTLLKEQTFPCMVFVCDELLEADVEFLQAVSAHPSEMPVLILTPRIGVHLYSQARLMDNMVALQSPCDDKIILGIIDKMSAERSFRFDVCPRFITNEPVRMMVRKTGLLIPTRMRNYSATGAFLEYRGISLKIGDRIQLNLGTLHAAPKKEQVMVEAKVVWIREGDGLRSPARGVGVQFIETAKTA